MPPPASGWPQARPAPEHAPERIMPADIEATLSRLRNAFIAQLPSRMEMLERLLTQLAQAAAAAGDAPLADATKARLDQAMATRMRDRVLRGV